MLDLSLLSAALAIGWRRPGALAFALWYAVASFQWWWEGFYWQFLAAYLMVAVSAKWKSRIAFWLLTPLLLGPWALLPVPSLTSPEGAYPVGTRVYRWVDASRPEAATPDPADHRNVIVQAWYPTSATAGTHSIYLDGLGRLPRYVSLLPSFIMRRYDRIETHAISGAPISTRQGTWPVILFSPGYGAPRAFYTSVVTGLASQGYIVLALDHPYEAAVTQLADGTIATMVENFSPGDPDRLAFMAARLEVRAADVRFVLDHLGALTGLDGHLDLNRIAAIGHSFGGATAAVALDRDPRLDAAVNIDGTLYGDIASHRLKRPFLLLESDLAETGHSARYRDGNGQLRANSLAPVQRRELHHANHYSFTDAPLLLAPPARWALSLLAGGALGPRETHRATVSIVTAFLREGSVRH